MFMPIVSPCCSPALKASPRVTFFAFRLSSRQQGYLITPGRTVQRRASAMTCVGSICLLLNSLLSPSPRADPLMLCKYSAQGGCALITHLTRD
jgi:hypothetical protein